MPVMSLPDFRNRLFKPLLLVIVSLVTGLFGSVAAACPNWSLTGQQISYTSDQLWVPQTHSVVAGGSNNLNNCSQPGTGYVATAPDFDLTFSQNGMGRDLEIRVNASCDSVLLVNAANGQWYFDDDGGEGLNSALRIPNAPEGVYDIWVGTYGPSTCNATMTLETFGGGAPGGTVAPPPQGACPNPGLNGQMISYDGQGLWVPQSFPVVAGGNIDLRACPSVPGHGHIIQSPDFTLNFTGNPQNYALEFRVDGTCDPVLLVNDANGQWHFNDDADGLNSRLRIEGARPGLYDIWVGTYGSTNCNATLTAETFPAQTVRPPQPSLCPDPGMNGQMITSDGQGLWVPQRFPVVAGGNVDLGSCGSVPGHGHIVQGPDFTLNFTSNPQNYDLEFRVDAACDSVLLINDANGQWQFDDDGGDGLNSLMRLAAARPGMYDIWVGTYGSTNCNATLIAETFPGQGGGGGGQNFLPDPGNLTGYRGQVGQTFTFQVTGADNGSVWGTDIYTDDSRLARAAVHAGLLQVGQTGTVQVQILPGQQSYQGSTRNGVQSANYGSWSGSYQFIGAPPPPSVLPDPGNLTGYRGQVGQTFTFEVTGANTGSVWGTDIYTDDSRLARAAVHAGLLQVGQTGNVQVQILPGQQSYQGSTRNGVQSANYGSWSGSYQFVRSGGGWSGQITSQLIAVHPSADRDLVGRGEGLQPNNVPDGLYRIGVTAPGQVVTGIEIRNSGGIFSVWDTTPNGHWITAVVVNGTVMNQGNGTVNFGLVQGETILDLYAENNGAIGSSGMNITISFASGQQTVVSVPAGFSGGPMPGGTPTPPSPGLIRILSATYGGNCGAPQGNATDHIAAQCNGQMSCTYLVDYTVIGDPVPGCRKDYAVSYDCGDGRVLTGSAAAEAGFRSPVALQCTAQAPQPAPVAGTWSINANGWTGTLELDQHANGWSGTVHFDAHGRTEVLENVGFDPASGMVTFTRPISGATQMYRGTLTGDQISGQFNQGGGAYGYTWSATRVSSPGGAPQPTVPAPGGGAPGK